MAPKNKKTQKKKQQLRYQKRNSNRSTWLAIGAIAIFVIVFAAVAASGVFKGGESTLEPIAPTKVLLQTTAGNITIDLRTDKPLTSTNFINLVKEGKYDGTAFHRTVANFMIQGGRVNSSVSAIKDEIGSNNSNTKYTIAMANTNQANSATSEFFINVADNGIKYASSGFDKTYTVFGTVISGKDVVDAIANAPATENPYITGEISVPVDPVTIIKATIVP